MRKRFELVCALAAMLAFTTPSCHEEVVEDKTLVGSNWKLIAIVDVQTNDMKVLEPKDCEECYTLTFNTGNTFLTHSSTNNMSGSYVADYTTNSISIFNFGGTKIGEIGDGKLWWEVFPTIQSFTLQNNKLMLHYNNNKNHLYFKPLEEL